MAHAMGSTAKVMAATNKQLKVEDIQRTMANFEKESTKMDMAGEMSKFRIECHTERIYLAIQLCGAVD